MKKNEKKAKKVKKKTAKKKKKTAHLLLDCTVQSTVFY